MNRSRKILVFVIFTVFVTGGIWYWGGVSTTGLGSSVLSVDTFSCSAIPGKMREVEAEKSILEQYISQLQKDIRNLAQKKIDMNITSEQVQSEKDRLAAFEESFFRKTQFKNAQKLSVGIQIVEKLVDDISRERKKESNSFMTNRLLARKLRVVKREYLKYTKLSRQYETALSEEQKKIQQNTLTNTVGQEKEIKVIIAQIAEKELAKKNSENALTSAKGVYAQLLTKNTTCLEAAQAAARQESAKREQNTVSTVAVDTNANANTNTNTNANANANTNTNTNANANANTNTSGNTDTNPPTNTITPGNTTQANTTQRTTNTSSGSGGTASTSSGTTKDTPVARETVTTNTGTQSSAVVAQAETVTPVTTQTAPVVTTSSPVEVTPTAPVTQQTSSVVQEVNNQGAASTQTVTAQKENIGVVYSGLPGFTEFTEIRNPLKSLMVSNFNNKLINVEGGKVCWFSVKQVGNIQNIPFWIQQSWEGYKSIFLDQIYFYFDNKPTSNNEEPFSITTYIEKCINANNRISNDCWIESSNIKKRITEDRKYQISTSQVPFPGAWFQAKNVYFSYHANSPGIRTLSNGGSIFDRDFIFYGCVDKNEPVPKF